MIQRVLALVIDFRTTEEARNLTVQLARFHRSDAGFGLKVVHVDNFNQEAVVLSQEQKDLGVELLRLNVNNGYAAGLIGGIEKFKDQGFDAYWMLNSDLEVEPNTLSRLVQVLNSQPRAGAVGPTVLKNRGPEVWGTRGVVSPGLGITAMTPWPKGGCLPKWSYIPGSTILVRRKAYDEVGGLPVRYRMYYEETELCVQLQRHGWELWVDSEAIAYHFVASMKANIPARHYAYYFTRNNLYFWNKNFGIPAWVQLPRTLLVVAKELVLPLRKARSLSDVRDRLNYVWAGLLDSREFFEKRFTRRERALFEISPGDNSN